MTTENTILVILLLVIIAEITYVISKLPRGSIKTKRRAILVDTSILMDGRIISIAKTGFIGDTLVIPRSVVGELQLVADNSDSEKRARARRGLDVVAELQAMPEVDVELLQDSTTASEGVDNRLLALAKQHHALIMTIDFNLSKVAHVEGIQVLNINDLSQGIRMAHLPGERLKIQLVQNGQDGHQAVGYLEDGTMVVVEQSRAYVGKTVEVEVIRSLQTSAGKMMFAKRVSDESQSAKPAKHQGIQPAKTSGRARKTYDTAHQPSTERPAGNQANASKPATDRARSEQRAPQRDTGKQPKGTQQNASSSASRPRRKKKDREDILIELTNNQP